ncbi:MULTISPECIES: hypothetical protein [Burkholderia]|uniref:hypothetical protein n=1 Tax=Burkholderia TaxID=32008 RepID=UPI000E649B7E|nr:MULTISPECIES: hypothetical protein [Burkholderia]MCR5895668.1 hypothetical protein [Burkholderia sp. HAN2018]
MLTLRLAPAAPPALRGLLENLSHEERRVDDYIPLTANENRMSDLACAVQASLLSHRYLLGQADERGEQGRDFVKGGLMLDGLPAVTALEQRAVAAARAMYGVEAVELRPLSGLHATLTTLLSLSRPGAVVLSIDPAHNGHFATRGLVTALGRRSAYLAWDKARDIIDAEAAARQVEALPDGSLVLIDHSAPRFPQPVAALRAALRSDVCISYDASHTLGLIAGGQFQDPIGEGADVLQGNTHKTFPGPQKGMILAAREAVGRRIGETMCDYVISSQHTHHALALYVTLLEMEVHARAYARQVVTNALALADALSAMGFAVRRRADGAATASHMLLIGGFEGGRAYEFCARLRACGLSVNARTDRAGELIRIGIQELTRRNVRVRDIKPLAELIRRAGRTDESPDRIRADVREYLGQFAAVGYSFCEPDLTSATRAAPRPSGDHPIEFASDC